jgi:hypothetical protein
MKLLNKKIDLFNSLKLIYILNYSEMSYQTANDSEDLEINNPEEIIHTESYFRRTPVLVASIMLRVAYIICCSMVIGELIGNEVRFLDLPFWFSFYLFESVIYLLFEIKTFATDEKDPERASLLMAIYLGIGAITSWKISGDPTIKDYSKDSFIFVMYVISIIYNAFSFLYALTCVTLLTRCRRGIPEHNVSLRKNCRCL